MKDDSTANRVGLDLDAIEARANAATEGPWFFDSYSTVVSEPLVREYDRIEATIPCGVADDDPRWDALPETHVCGVPCIAGDTGTAQGVRDARFIAEARSDVPALCSEVRRLRAEMGKLDALWRELTVERDREEKRANNAEALLSAADVAIAAMREERACSEADEVTLDPRQYRWELAAHEVAERVQSRAIVAADDASGELLDALLTSGVPSLVSEIKRLQKKNRSLRGKLIDARQKLYHAWKSGESTMKSLAYAQRQLAAAQQACPHPVDDRAPVSGDGWICERCSASVEAPPPHVADGDWNSDAVAVAMMALMRYPAPLLTVAAEVLNLAPSLADVDGGPGKVADAWRDIANEAQSLAGRSGLLTIAMLAIHGAMSCDAENG